MSLDCTICCDTLSIPSGCCSVTRCGHVFHTECLNKWFEHQTRPTCPLCKTERGSGTFVRELRPPEHALSDLSDKDLERLAMLVGEPSASAEAAQRSAIARAVQEQQAVDVEQAAVDGRRKQKRTRVDKLNSELMQLKRQLHSCQQKERQQQKELQRISRDEPRTAELWTALEEQGDSDAAPHQPLEGLAGREAVMRQSKQLCWRAHELRALDEKVRVLRAELAWTGQG